MATSYTHYQLVYGLHILLLAKYVLLAISVDHRDAELTKVLITTKITKLEKLQEKRLEAQNIMGAN